jgi:hypothetical protein
MSTRRSFSLGRGQVVARTSQSICANDDNAPVGWLSGSLRD